MKLQLTIEVNTYTEDHFGAAIREGGYNHSHFDGNSCTRILTTETSESESVKAVIAELVDRGLPFQFKVTD